MSQGPARLAFITVFNTVTAHFNLPKAQNFDLAQFPFSDKYVVAGTLISYVLLVVGGQRLFRAFPALGTWRLQPLFVAHNALLSLGSLLLLLPIIETVFPVLLYGVKAAPSHRNNWLEWPIHFIDLISSEKGRILLGNHLHEAVCSSELPKDRILTSMYYVNYLFKYYELFDTCFLVLRRKPLEFLHVYHHALTALLCFTQLLGYATVQWVPISINLGVHVLMYYYYARSALGARLWWKQHLTTMQIVQFVIDLVAIFYCYFYLILSIFRPALYPDRCYGEEYTGLFAVLLLSSYLGLFIQFFFKTYSKPAVKDSKKKSQ